MLPPSFKRPQRQRPGAFQVDRLVQRREGLQRRIRPRAAHAGEVAIGGVERLKHRVRHRAIAKRVEGTAVSFGPGRLVPDLGPVAGRRLEQERRRGRADARAADLRRRAARSPPGRCRAPISASTRNRGPRASKRLYGSRASSSGVGRDDCRYMAESTISRCRCLRLQPFSMNSTASQSSSSGCEGGSHCRPRSSLVADQAGSEIGLPDPVDQRSGRRRRVCGRPASAQMSDESPARPAAAVQERRHARLDRLARLEKITPLQDVRRPRGSSRSQSTSCVDPSGCCFQSASIQAFASSTPAPSFASS